MQAQLADARQEVQDQAAQAKALQSRLETANQKGTKQDQERSNLQVQPCTTWGTCVACFCALVIAWGASLQPKDVACNLQVQPCLFPPCPSALWP